MSMHKKGDFLKTINQGFIHILLTGVLIIFLKCRHCFNFVRPQQLLPQFYCNTCMLRYRSMTKQERYD